jgi:tRNA-Thr(GGU) m(6)t(6)A37 methyltransferase TsaA
VTIALEPVAYVTSSRGVALDDDWDAETATIQLVKGFDASALEGLSDFSHVEVVFHFHLVEPHDVLKGARHPRGNRDWPLTGIFAQRAKARPNRLGSTICRLVKVDGATITVSGLDAIDGTPVLDIKPVMRGFLPRGEVHEPQWATELMLEYWKRDE